MWLPSSPTWPPNDLSRQAAMAERIGFDSVWSIDSQLLCRDVMVSLTGILFATTTLRAATGVTQPVTRHASVTGWDDGDVIGNVRLPGGSLRSSRHGRTSPREAGRFAGPTRRGSRHPESADSRARCEAAGRGAAGAGAAGAAVSLTSYRPTLPVTLRTLQPRHAGECRHPRLAGASDVPRRGPGRTPA
jgi:hypothetical protein